MNLPWLKERKLKTGGKTSKPARLSEKWPKRLSSAIDVLDSCTTGLQLFEARAKSHPELLFCCDPISEALKPALLSPKVLKKSRVRASPFLRIAQAWKCTEVLAAGLRHQGLKQGSIASIGESIPLLEKFLLQVAFERVGVIELKSTAAPLPPVESLAAQILTTPALTITHEVLPRLVLDGVQFLKNGAFIEANTPSTLPSPQASLGLAMDSLKDFLLALRTRIRVGSELLAVSADCASVVQDFIPWLSLALLSPFQTGSRRVPTLCFSTCFDGFAKLGTKTRKLPRIHILCDPSQSILFPASYAERKRQKPSLYHGLLDPHGLGFLALAPWLKDAPSNLGKPLASILVREREDNRLEYQRMHSLSVPTPWLATGVLGHINRQGAIEFYGRETQRLSSQDAEHFIFIDQVEHFFNQSKWIHRCKLTLAEELLQLDIELNAECALSFAKEHHLLFSAPEELAKHPRIVHQIQKWIDRWNDGRSEDFSINHFTLTLQAKDNAALLWPWQENPSSSDLLPA